ncbi:hypothetical protein, partial [Dickeya dadantii]|uniref:hypothetical protein n=1 Tax=Dickeya dadantii TaxID=204038 RepID=UPI001C130769
HSDTSPDRRRKGQRGATIGSRPVMVKQYFRLLKRLANCCSTQSKVGRITGKKNTAKAVVAINEYPAD